MNMEPRILALDIGTKLGWALVFYAGPNAVLYKHRTVISGVENLAPGPNDSSDVRLRKFRNFLEEKLGVFSFVRIVFEDVPSGAHKGGRASAVYNQLLGVLLLWTGDREISREGIAIGTIKKFATGKGNASKELMIEAAERYGYKPKDDNEADALMLLHCALARDGNKRKEKEI